MSRTGDSKITPFGGDEFTCITFTPDLSKFKMSALDKDTVALMTRRAYDIAGASKGVRVVLNGKKIPVSYRASYFEAQSIAQNVTFNNEKNTSYNNYLSDYCITL